MYVYIDESGDLGFSEGSTAYFTIAFVVTDDPVRLGRTVKRVKRKYNIPRNVELKGSATRKDIKLDLLTRLSLLNIELHAITVLKKNVDNRLKKDTNILYNYVVGLSLIERVLQEPPHSRVFVRI